MAFKYKEFRKVELTKSDVFKNLYLTFFTNLKFLPDFGHFFSFY